MTKLSARLLGLFGDVRSGEAPRALVMFANLFLLMIAYYVLKTVREPLVLASGSAEVKTYAAGLQALLLIAFVPAYGQLTRRVGRRGLILGLVGFFFVTLQGFALSAWMGWRFVGVAFYIWVGIFSLSAVAQFWSLANDLYSEPDGRRLFPIIAFGATLGSPIGAWVAGKLFRHGASPQLMLQIAAVLLLAHGALALRLVPRGAHLEPHHADDASLSDGPGGFQLIARSRYLRLIVVLLVLLNLVNTIGEYVLSRNVILAAGEAVAAGRAVSTRAFIGSFYGGFFFWVNVAAAFMQAFLVSRLVRRLGLRGVVLFLPVVAVGVYGTLAAGVGIVVVRWLKALENATDYSVMNTGRAMLWLPTSRAEKYRAKQAADTFFVRAGDVLAMLVVLATSTLHLDLRLVAAINATLAVTWVFVAWRLASPPPPRRADRAAQPAPLAFKAA